MLKRNFNGEGDYFRPSSIHECVAQITYCVVASCGYNQLQTVVCW